MIFLRVLFILFFVNPLYAHPFNFIKKETDKHHTPTLLVIGGIHGNEPGSYFATALLAQYYHISKGNLWIVPNLNRLSIQQNLRGIHGDMNRKFAEIAQNDPDVNIVQEIQKIITDPQVSLILNLHDGHGFYRKAYQNTIFNPNAWGQTCVIDQGNLDSSQAFANLNEIATKVSQEVNAELIENHHYFDVRNTNTKFDDEAMKRSLTYFAVTHNKPAFAIESSKNLPSLQEKVFYQLRAIECYMKVMGITFERSFDLTPQEIEKIVNLKGKLTINNNQFLDLDDLKNSLSLIPLQSNGNDFNFSHPLGSVSQKGKEYVLYIGNQKISSLHSSYQFAEKCTDSIVVEVDEQQQNIMLATDFLVTADFKVINHDPKTRINIIGFTKEGVKDESNLKVKLKDFNPKYSIDSSKRAYRIEFYRQNRFCGMVLAHFK